MTKSSEKSQHVVFIVKDLDSFVSHRSDLAKVLINKGFRVSLFTDMKGVSTFPYREILTTVQDLPLSVARQAPWKLIIPMISLFRFLSANRNVTVFSITLLAVLIAGFFCKILGIRQIILFAGLGNTFHGQSNFVRRLLKSLLKVITRKNKTDVIVHNNEIKTLLIKNGYAAKITVISGSGINVAAFTPPKRERSNDPPKILFFGRLLKEKGLIEFIEASKLTLQSGHRAEFILAGRTDTLNPTSISESELEKHLIGEEHIKWIGPSKGVKDLLASVDVMCLPSYHEGLPRSLLEGALMGCCLVATDIPGCNEIVISGQTGILVSPRSSQALAEAFISLIKNPAKISELAANARTHVLKNFTNDLILPKYFDVIKNY